MRFNNYRNNKAIVTTGTNSAVAPITASNVEFFAQALAKARESASITEELLKPVKLSNNRFDGMVLGISPKKEGSAAISQGVTILVGSFHGMNSDSNITVVEPSDPSQRTCIRFPVIIEENKKATNYSNQSNTVTASDYGAMTNNQKQNNYQAYTSQTGKIYNRV